MAEDVLSGRMIALTDGVLSIAMTLLVLDIRLPIAAESLTDGALWRALLGISTQLESYCISFLVVGIFWLNHAQKFRHLAKLSGTIIWLNIFFLLAIGLVPFTTSLLAENGNAVSTSIYAAVMAFASSMLGLMSLHAGNNKLTDDAISFARLRSVVLSQFATALVFVASIGVAFVNPSWAKYCWLLLVPLAFVLRHGDKDL